MRIHHSLTLIHSPPPTIAPTPQQAPARGSPRDLIIAPVSLILKEQKRSHCPLTYSRRACRKDGTWRKLAGMDKGLDSVLCEHWTWLDSFAFAMAEIKFLAVK